MKELLKIDDKQNMNKYKNSIDRISFKIEETASNLGLDLDDQPLSEDIKNIFDFVVSKSFSKKKCRIHLQ